MVGRLNSSFFQTLESRGSSTAAKGLLFDFQPDEVFVLDGIDLVGDEVERSAGHIGSGHRIPNRTPQAGIAAEATPSSFVLFSI
jgi:hypothetical protein